MVRLGLATPGLQKTEFLHNFQSLRSTLNLFPLYFLATPYSRKTLEGVLDSPLAWEGLRIFTTCLEKEMAFQYPIWN